MMNIDFLEQKRKLNDLTQEEMARILGMGKASYQKIEAGINNLHPRHWKKINSTLGTTDSELSKFTAMVAVKRRKKRISSGEIKPDIVDQVILASEQAKNIQERCEFIATLTDYEYSNLVNALEQYKENIIYGGSKYIPDCYLDMLEDKVFDCEYFTADEKVKFRQFLKAIRAESKK